MSNSDGSGCGEIATTCGHFEAACKPGCTALGGSSTHSAIHGIHSGSSSTPEFAKCPIERSSAEMSAIHLPERDERMTTYYVDERNGRVGSEARSGGKE